MAHYELNSIRNSINSNIGADFSHSGGTQAIAANTWTKLLNDTLGTYTDEGHTPIGSATLYDRTNNQIQLEPYPLGSIIGLRLDATITTVGATQIDIRLKWQAKDEDGNNTFAFYLTKTIGQTQAGTLFCMLEPFEFTIDGEDQRRGNIEIQLYVKGTTGTLQMNGIKIYRK